MGHREVKRVSLSFDWPLKKTWGGYLRPERLHEKDCPNCKGGYSPRAQYLHDLWYGYVPFAPKTPLRSDTPAVRAFAERNVSRSPDYYGNGGLAVAMEARRLADLWNEQWSHHLEQEDVDALVAAGRLMDFTHTWTPEARWQPKDPPFTPTAAQVNEWSISGGMGGHDGINSWVVIKARCKREGVPVECATCKGHGSVEAYEGQRAEAEEWKATEPPEGDGWQLWETTSEGSPVSPVFPTAEALADWCADNATIFGSAKLSREKWLQMFVNETTDVGSLMIAGGGKGFRPMAEDMED